ncbi:hypothetical protein FGO68_gene4934 [Halteria grandinella]|uniref:Protein kinase domain-containing protein n=1 Tax=Halteria grandinella TaxID=5974 RepID=A0A8J8T3F9_HALGN|nr:hypothetical protein FGO68_gene4934 [Halteria grandinella]
MEAIEQQLVIKHYRTIKKLAEGKLATVHLAFDESHHRLCSVKLQKIIDNEVKRCKSNQAFIKEISALKKAKHPFIIELIDSFYWEPQNQPSRWVLVLEHADGGTLYDTFIKPCKPPPDKHSLAWFAQLSLALAHLNSLSINKVNLNPYCIVIVGEKTGGVAKIGEMGYVTSDCIDKEGKLVSASRYYAPEQFNEEGVTKKNNWALGIVFYELLTGGQHPFESSFNEISYLTRLPKLEFRQNSMISKDMKDLFKLLLEKNPLQRICIQDLLCRDIPIQGV